jgi:hypothetical protein
MGRVPEAIERTETWRPEELVVSLSMHDQLRSDWPSNVRFGPGRSHRTMNRSLLYLSIGALIVATVVFGYLFYQERQKTSGIDINVGKSGVSIEKN